MELSGLRLAFSYVQVATDFNPNIHIVDMAVHQSQRLPTIPNGSSTDAAISSNLPDLLHLARSSRVWCLPDNSPTRNGGSIHASTKHGVWRFWPSDAHCFRCKWIERRFQRNWGWHPVDPANSDLLHRWDHRCVSRDQVGEPVLCMDLIPFNSTSFNDLAHELAGCFHPSVTRQVR